MSATDDLDRLVADLLDALYAAMVRRWCLSRADGTRATI